MNSYGVEDLLALQRPDGSFASIVTSRNGRCVDYNGCVVAMVLRLLRRLPEGPTWAELRDRGLNFLWSCRSPQIPGAFAFWPDQSRPAWASKVPADVDDTAVMLAELLRHGRLDRLVVMRSVCNVIVPCRVSTAEAEMLPSWVVPGSFVTWMTAATIAPTATRSTNVVDCCVNTNVIALMSQLKAEHLPGYESAIHTVLNGLDWAGVDKRRLASLTPFYPSIGSLVDALEHAIECGADPLRDGLRRLKSVGPDLLNANAGCCSSAYGKTVWRCEAIDRARAIAGASDDGRFDRTSSVAVPSTC